MLRIKYRMYKDSVMILQMRPRTPKLNQTKLGRVAKVVEIVGDGIS